MDAPKELSFDEILKFMIAHNGKVTNHELVNHFKVFLMNPRMRDEARNTFKKHVNTLVIIKNQNNEKWLILKKKYLLGTSAEKDDILSNNAVASHSTASIQNEESSVKQELIDSKPPPPLQLNQDMNILNNIVQNIMQSPTITKAESIESVKESIIQEFEDTPPKLLPRSKSSDKCSSEKISDTALGHRSSIPNQETLVEAFSPTLTASRSESMLLDNEQKISVKERKQMFNRMASESDVVKSNKVSGNLSNSSVDEEDRASLDQKGDAGPLDSKQKSWILCAARGEYHALAKMCKENAKLVKTKDPFTTAMHWACKRGDENLVKLLAGVHRHVVNERSNGGYTPLHIAMQFRHENVYRILVDVYDADQNVRDWSGRKPRQYLVHMDTTMSPGTYRKSDLNLRRRTVEATPSVKVCNNNALSPTKKESFLRIGSLNVRVKKTTEAFSNFLGVGATRSSAYLPKSRDRDGDKRSDDGDHIHKSWGSADNIQKEVKIMPPPNSSKVRRRGVSGRKGIGSHSRSTPSTPDQPRAQIGTRENGDSDSDSAAGFHSSWRQQRASCT